MNWWTFALGFLLGCGLTSLGVFVTVEWVRWRANEQVKAQLRNR